MNVASVLLASGFTFALAMPASAATIIQLASNQGPFEDPGSFEGFDYSLGRLDSVVLEISGSESRIFGATFPDGATNPITIDWAIDGNASFKLHNFPSGSSALVSLPISGSGQVVVTEDWSWDMTTYGSGVFAIDPALIPNRSDYLGPELRLNFMGPGFYDNSDTQFSTSEPIQINLSGGNCSDGFGEERCNRYFYRLTYEYTPGSLLDVPEPTTWVMMIFGFGAIGRNVREANRKKMSTRRFA